MRLTLLVTLAAISIYAIPPGMARRAHHSYRSTSRGYAAGPNDEGGHDYRRHTGSPSRAGLSTGWTHGRRGRSEQTHDYYRHTRSGKIIHVHGYWRRAR